MTESTKGPVQLSLIQEKWSTQTVLASCFMLWDTSGIAKGKTSLPTFLGFNFEVNGGQTIINTIIVGVGGIKNIGRVGEDMGHIIIGLNNRNQFVVVA